MNNKLGYFLLAAGGLLVTVSFSADFIGLGKKGFQSAQIGGIVLGVMLALVGLGLRSLPDNKKTFRQIIVEKTDTLLDWPIMAWVLIGFLMVYLSYFVGPMFFDKSQRFSYFSDYIPAFDVIGHDLNYNTQAISLWLQGQNPYALGYHFYPPLYHVIFAPILVFDVQARYFLMTALSLLSFGLIFFILWQKNSDNHGIFLFFFLTGLFSYGMQFELERGQFNVLALLLVIISVWLFYHAPSFRLLAYTLWLMATHIKLYPGIFLLMFFPQWDRWKENFTRLFQLMVLNIAAFAVLGYEVFLQFVKTITSESDRSFWLLPDQQPITHSIIAFLDKLAKNNDNEIPAELAGWLTSSSSWVAHFLLVVILACGAVIIWRTLKNRPNLLHADILMLFILLGCLVPAVSIDYKLVLLAPGMAVLLVDRVLPELRWKKILFIGLTILMSVAYSITLVPYRYRSGLLITAFPMLFIMLLCLTGLNLLNNKWKQLL